MPSSNLVTFVPRHRDEDLEAVVGHLDPSRGVVEVDDLNDIVEHFRSRAHGHRVQRVDLIGHGTPGTLQLGSTSRGLLTPCAERLAPLRGLRDYFEDDATGLFLFGCDVAAVSKTDPSRNGRLLVFALSELIGVDVWAPSTVVSRKDFPNGVPSDSGLHRGNATAFVLPRVFVEPPGPAINRSNETFDDWRASSAGPLRKALDAIQPSMDAATRPVEVEGLLARADYVLGPSERPEGIVVRDGTAVARRVAGGLVLFPAKRNQRAGLQNVLEQLVAKKIITKPVLPP